MLRHTAATCATGQQPLEREPSGLGIKFLCRDGCNHDVLALLRQGIAACVMDEESLVVQHPAHLGYSAAAMVTNVASVAVQPPAAWPASAGSLVSRGAALLFGRVMCYTPAASPVAFATSQQSSACRRHRHERGQQP